MSRTQVFYAEGGEYLSKAHNRASVGNIALGGELNHTTLFGGQQTAEEELPYMFVSDQVSGANGELVSETALDIERRDIDGITMIFDPAGGTHPQRVDLWMYSMTQPNFENVLKSQSFERDMRTRVSESGLQYNTMFDAATGEKITRAGFVTTGLIFTELFASGVVIRTRGIDWNVGNRAFIGVNVYARTMSGNAYAPIWRKFASVENLMKSATEYGAITIDANGNAEISISPVLSASFIELCVSADSIASEDDVIITVGQPITYGEDQTEEPTESFASKAAFPIESAVQFLDYRVKNVSRIEMEFHGTNAPYVRHKLTSIYAGEMMLYDTDSIVSCDIIEQIDPIAETIPTGTCDLVLFSDVGIRYNPSVRQRLEVYRDGDLRGVYFVDNVTKSGGRRYTINAHGWTGELGKYTFYGDVYKDVYLTGLVGEIFAAAGMPYTIDTDTIPIKVVSGYIPITDCKTALRMLLFSVGAYVDANRMACPHVRGFDVDDRYTDADVTDVLIGEKITEQNSVASIELTARTYTDQYDTAQTQTPTRKVYSWEDYGKGYKPIVIIPSEPSVVWRTDSNIALMIGSTATRILWDGTLSYLYTDDQGNQYYSDKWAVSLYPYNVRETAYSVTAQGLIGASIRYDNTMMAPENIETIGARCLAWYMRGSVLDVGIAADVQVGKNISVVLSYGEEFSGTVTQIRYSAVGNRMIQEVVLRGFDNGSYARRL